MKVKIRICGHVVPEVLICSEGVVLGHIVVVDWQRVEEVFHLLSDEPPDRWRQLADEACGDDPRVRLSHEQSQRSR